ncbi:fibromodulin [Esox lucius]|uniref:Fibromodulin n=1 Tax=Esox lucius TaxID=8010 RepID=A0A3P8X758_ESOLU|nr:fibromodulin [Esox lucius]
MRMVVLLIVAGLVDLSFPQRLSAVQWLNYLRNRHRPLMWAERLDDECPLECDCPASFPVAMYCHSRNLQHIPYVPSRIKYVYLQRNQITGIQDGVFDNATSLIWIMLHQNQLSSDRLGKNVFSKLKNLDRLYLDNNELTRVPPNLPKSIKDLRLGHNKIAKIQSSAFEGMYDLATLHLQANHIEDVGGAFKGLKSLNVLDLRKNKLKKIPYNLPEILHQLYLEFNHIESIPADFLTMYPNLQFVRLAHNKLTNEGIPPNTFNVSGLVELDLSHNKLKKIPTVSKSLENLYLQANQINEFSLSSFCDVVDMMNYSQLKVLRMEGNKISAKDVPAKAVYCLRLAVSIHL